MLSTPTRSQFYTLSLKPNLLKNVLRRTPPVSASEMTYIVSSGALNSTHSLPPQSVSARFSELWNSSFYSYWFIFLDFRMCRSHMRERERDRDRDREETA